MMQKLWIFGDSHADPNANYKEYKHIRLHELQNIDEFEHTSTILNVYSTKTEQRYDTDCLTYEGWAYWLSKEYDVENYAQAGIGGDTCFLRLTNKTDEHTDCKNIKVIFILADMESRVPMMGYEASKQWSFLFHAYDKKDYDQIISKANIAGDWIDTYRKYHEFAKTFMMDHMKTDEYQNRIKLFLGALDHYAGFFKSFICIPVNNHKYTATEWKKQHTFQNMEVRYDLTLEPLAEQGEMPNEMYQQVFRGRKQGRLTAKNLWPNHLDTKHNRYFYEQMKEWIETDG
jgi:hypothetical protein